ncbi:G-type lectin S-receptor-like serine/threonine-protein kinase [Camellia lanceoleosa]|uniref:G-type lectin S-receptor-like serine/threonine-protein kinase n=1 Tax=Camellia lanceoleosa TaxID=1840588 RepID=A0ACC0HSE5_9ERIC|nr:G-type lectin S-receptor-like serine/threonine-protein kinase [Camellia lanceoleosa]
MGSSLFVLAIFFLSCSLVSCITSTEFLYPNFTASNLQFVDNFGNFLISRNGTFKASLFNPNGQQTNFYLCVIHMASNAITWSANRNASISNSGKMSLTFNGISITDQDGAFKWSTPPLKASVSALQLTEMGNLVLLDQFNVTLWESFRYPTDTIVIGQNLPVGLLLSSAVSSGDLSTGNYRLAVSASDALLQWQNLTYWKLSMDAKAYTNSNYAVEYMAINQTGLYLFGHNGSVVVIQVNLSPSEFRIAKLDYSGQFNVFSGSSLSREFVGPDDKCQIPFICGRLGLCSDDAASNPTCSCPPNFHAISNSADCVPSDGSYSLSVSCSSTDNNSGSNASLVSYSRLGYGIDYFANDFTMPVKSGVNLSVCEDLCSGDCSCLGVFFENSSGLCFVLQNELGSVMSTTGRNADRLGFIKTLVGSSPTNGNNNFNGQALRFPIVGLVLLPFTGFFLLVALGFFWWRRSRISETEKVKLSYPTSPSSGDLDSFSIPGLPVRFDHSIDDDTSGGGYSSSSSGPPQLVYFPLFALEMHEQGKYLEVADLRLEGRVTSEEVEKLVRVALCCVHEEPALRPNMVSVVGMLECETPVGQPRLESLNFLRFYGRRFTEASTIEENDGQDDFMLYPRANASVSSKMSGSPTSFSYISSQQVSGPR